MGWFGPSKDEVWRQLSQEIGAEFVERRLWKGSKVQAQVGPWTVTLDTATSDEDGDNEVTRLRAPYVNPEGFRFTIYRKGFLSDLARRMGMQDVEVGDPDFDAAFVIKGNDEGKVRTLFSDPKLRQLIQEQPRIRLEVKDSEGWFGPRFPENVDELRFQAIGVIKDVDRLKSLFDLFAAVLDRLCRMGSAYRQDAGVEL